MDCKGASIISIGDRRATGKREKEFKPRAKCTYCRDLAILNGTRAEPPREGTPQVVRGEIASGDQVVDASSNDFFRPDAQSMAKDKCGGDGRSWGGYSHRSGRKPGNSHKVHYDPGVSDLPRARGKNKGRKERDAWKAYASDAAAAFVMGWIAEGLPMPRSPRMADL